MAKMRRNNGENNLRGGKQMKQVKENLGGKEMENKNMEATIKSKKAIRREVIAELGKEDIQVINELVKEMYEAQFIKEEVNKGGIEMKKVEEVKQERIADNEVVSGHVNGEKVYYVYKPEHLLQMPEQVFTLADVMYKKSHQMKSAKMKAGQFDQPNKSYKGFSMDSNETFYKKNVPLVGTAHYIYNEAWEVTDRLKPVKDVNIDVKNVNETFNSIKTEVLKEYNSLKEDNKWLRDRSLDGSTMEFEKLPKDVMEANKHLKAGVNWKYRLLFDQFKDYGYEVVSMFTVTYFLIEGGKKVEQINRKGKYVPVTEKTIFVKWRGQYGEFAMEFPFIDANGFFSNNGSQYDAMFSIDYKQKERILRGDHSNIELIHPYVYLCNQLRIKRYNMDGTPEMYEKEEFVQDVMSNRIGFKMRRKLQLILRNAHNTALRKKDKDEGTPIIWIDKFSSKMAYESLRSNVFLNFSFEELVECKFRIKGLDLLTGSTSKPGHRVQMAHNWKAKLGEDGKVRLVRKDNAIDDIAGDYLCSYKMFQAALGKTSAKRQNASTIKSTYQLVSPQIYKRHFKGSGFSEDVINSCVRTCFAAKIHLPEMIDDTEKLALYREIGLKPNTNDCFIISSIFSETFATYFREPGTHNRIVYKPGVGAKIYGPYRDKGSSTALLEKYIPVVDYKCNNEDEVNRLVEALTQIRGAFAKYQVKGNTVTFELDIIANPSVGRDNVEALMLQSNMEMINMFEGKYQTSSIAETSRMKVLDTLEQRQFEQTVRIVKYDDWNHTMKTFEGVYIMMLDYFVQPQHDNQYYHKEKANLSLNYHQSIDGMKALVPELYNLMINSLDYQRIKEILMCLGMSYIQNEEDVYNSASSRGKIEYDDKDEVELMN